MTNQKSMFWKNNMNYGAIAGFSLIIYYLILYFTNLMLSPFASWLQYVPLFVVCYLGTKYYRDKIKNGTITYGQSLGSGTLISLFSSFILGLYIFIFYKFIDDQALEQIISMTEDQLYAQGLPEESITVAVEMTRKMTTPVSMAIGTVFSITFMGFIFSTIFSSFMKKKSSSYDAAMAEIEKEIKEENK